jgi:hypothetical protein
MPEFMVLAPELRLEIYDFLFADIVRSLAEPSRAVEYHVCDENLEATADLDRYRGQRRTASLMPILRTCRQVYKEAESALYHLIYSQFRFVVRLRPTSDPLLDLSAAISDRLARERVLELHISHDDHVCEAKQLVTGKLHQNGVKEHNGVLELLA